MNASRLGAVALSIAVVGVLVAPPAEATGTRCAHSMGKRQNCMTVESKGTHVRGVKLGQTSRDPNDDNVCIGKVKWYVVSKDQVYEGAGDHAVYTCQYAANYVTLNIDRSFSDGSEICGIVYQWDEEEKIYPGQPCYTLKNG